MRAGYQAVHHTHVDIALRTNLRQGMYIICALLQGAAFNSITFFDRFASARFVRFPEQSRRRTTTLHPVLGVSVL
jgi:hypothetical protein